ncbi:M56 family metallopeptidase [Streptomyces sp. NPDC002262]|uniref:M56 family metallopeptidase n=1 Tax=Streptomyces sp. NPDC002262 TaxID=3154414 RepID=UPI00332EFFE2
MNAAPALLGYAALVGVTAPRVLLRSAWPHRAPALGVTVWLALTVTFVLAVALAAAQLASPTEHLHAGLVGLLHACGVGSGPAAPDPGTADRLAVALPAAVLGAWAGAVARRLLRAGRDRARHRARLDLVGVRCPRLRVTVLPHATPGAYCLPGLRARVVVSDAAVRLLSTRQLDAVVEHERAHVAGRHHLPLAAAEGFAALFRRLPLARHVRDQVALLLEMTADDRALRRHPDAVLATAMYELAAGRTPRGAFGAAGPSPAVLRMRRILGPRPAPHPALRSALASAAVTAPFLPLLVACPPGV